ncbi:hypothetical protein, partial [Nostoc sp. CCY 9925]|uniref:hypothetical protein n=1 Tax=Nostoc sp. CCY 9925 TaxID=3103865 RepID=UPI0039C61ED4
TMIIIFTICIFYFLEVPKPEAKKLILSGLNKTGIDQSKDKSGIILSIRFTNETNLSNMFY